MPVNAQKTVQELLNQFEQTDGEELLSSMIQGFFKDRICLVSSFGAEAAILLKMVSQINADLPVIFIDTQKLFPETLEYRNLLIKRFSLKDVRTYYPDYADTSRSDPNGELWQNDVNACCYIRKVKPLNKALKGFDAWITGRKRYQGSMRKDMALIEASDGRIKINPLASWNRQDIEKEFRELDIPAHPLAEKGYFSIGCEPCTTLPDNIEDARSGRWQGQDKTECGIHLGEDGQIKRSDSKIMD